MTSRYNQRVSGGATLRTHAEIAGFSAGTELLPPGVVQYRQWHPGKPARGAEGEIAAYCGLGRKPLRLLGRVQLAGNRLVLIRRGHDGTRAGPQRVVGPSMSDRAGTERATGSGQARESVP